MDDMYHARRMFGGGMPKAWPFAAVGAMYLEGYVDRLRRAIATADSVIGQLDKSRALDIQRIPGGTNVLTLELKNGDPQIFRDRLAERDVIVRKARKGSKRFVVQVNESINRKSAEQIIAAFDHASA